ncbi:DUF6290 family protein [Geomonas sp. RF6]|uniref:DUF6290 family protein n=1 Tax=Geomonas sp. RF6 TaxID=2897342 RepID=UPI001E6152A8|nr:DUF6290 family protein [Geomonas sp. RF6]UFS72059.1 DUF6290 family protein [Geomonas sp. RF6]
MKTIQVRLSDEEEAILEERVTRSGLTVSQLVRACLFEKSERESRSAARIEEHYSSVLLVQDGVYELAKMVGNLDQKADDTVTFLSQIAALLEAGTGGAGGNSNSENAIVSAQKIQASVEEMHREMRRFCAEALPGNAGVMLDQMVLRAVQEGLQPLHQGVRRADVEIDGLTKRLKSLTWKWRIHLGAVVAGVVSALIVMGTLGLARSEAGAEARRYELLGRTVEARFNQDPPKDKEKVWAWIYGVAGAPSGKDIVVRGRAR